MFRWDDLQLFLAIYRTKNLTRGAELVGVNQSTMSRRLSALEEALSLKLFDRTPDGLVATPIASCIYSEAEQVERLMHEVARLADGRDNSLKGTVRVAMPSGLSAHVVAPHLGSFFAAFPDIAIELVSGNDLVDLTRREADLALRFVRPQRGDLVFKKIIDSDYGIFGHREYTKTRESTMWETLDWLTWDRVLSHLPEARWYASNITKAPRATFNDMGTLMNALFAGVGVTLLPRMFLHHITQLEELTGEQSITMSMSIWLVGHRTLQHIPRYRVVWEFLEETIQNLADPKASIKHPALMF